MDDWVASSPFNPSQAKFPVLVTTVPEGPTVDAVERVQRRATRLIPGRARLSYEERLKETGLYTRERRRLRGDMIEIK